MGEILYAASLVIGGGGLAGLILGIYRIFSKNRLNRSADEIVHQRFLNDQNKALVKRLEQRLIAAEQDSARLIERYGEREKSAEQENKRLLDLIDAREKLASETYDHLLKRYMILKQEYFELTLQLPEGGDR